MESVTETERKKLANVSGQMKKDFLKDVDKELRRIRVQVEAKANASNSGKLNGKDR